MEELILITKFCSPCHIVNFFSIAGVFNYERGSTRYYMRFSFVSYLCNSKA